MIFLFDFIDGTRLNPIPPVGEYKWNQTVKSAGKLAVVVNASISLELPYITRNITVTFGSENQSYALNSLTEFAVFYFDQIDREARDYLLTVAFTVVEETGISIFGTLTTTRTKKETVRVMSPSNGADSKLTLSTLFYPIILTMLFFV